MVLLINCFEIDKAAEPFNLSFWDNFFIICLLFKNFLQRYNKSYRPTVILGRKKIDGKKGQTQYKVASLQRNHDVCIMFILCVGQGGWWRKRAMLALARPPRSSAAQDYCCSGSAVQVWYTYLPTTWTTS